MGMGGIGDAPRPMAIFELLEYIVDEVSYIDMQRI